MKFLQEKIAEKEATIEQKKKENAELHAEFELLKTQFTILTEQKSELKTEIESLQSSAKQLHNKIAKNDREIDGKRVDCDDLSERLTEQIANNEVLKEQVKSLQNTVKMKNELLERLQGDSIRQTKKETEYLETIGRLNRSETSTIGENLKEENERLRIALLETEQELNEKMIAYEKLLLDIDEQKKTIFHLNDVLTDSKSARSVEELRIEIRNLREANEKLKGENEQLKQHAERIERSTSPNLRPFSIDEITDRVEKELNYSAQLDSNIIKAIESDDVNSDNECVGDRNSLMTEIASLRATCHDLEQTKVKLQESLDAERSKLAGIREQDAKCIETMTHRLDAMRKHEDELQQLLDEERNKTAQLSTKILEHQFERSKIRTSSSEASLASSTASSPRRTKNSDFDHDTMKRLKDEIKLLKSQMQREKERGEDVEKSLQRERSRFEREINEQKSYSDGMKGEIDRLMNENQELQEELDSAHDR